MIRKIIILSLMTFTFYPLKQNLKVESKDISIECDKKGYPTTNAIKALITTQYLKQLSKSKISIKEVSGGYYTEKMYIVTSKKNGIKKNLFFLKISKKQTSTKNLISLQEGSIGQKFQENYSNRRSPSSQKKNLPVIIWLEDVLCYKNTEGKTKNIEVTPSAQGEVILDILNSHDFEKIKKAAAALGKSLAAFHQVYLNHNNSEEIQSWKAVCHGDFSVRNALFDIKTDKIYFIDNETMQEGSIGQDIRTILISVLMFRHLQAHNSKRWPIYLEYCKTFLNAYIESYPTTIRSNLATFIDKVLEDGLKRALYEKIIKDASIDRKKFKDKEFKKMVQNCLNKFKKEPA